MARIVPHNANWTSTTEASDADDRIDRASVVIEGKSLAPNPHRLRSLTIGSAIRVQGIFDERGEALRAERIYGRGSNRAPRPPDL